MMASNLISRLLPTETGSPSVYETIRQHDELSDNSDVEERAGMALDEENLGERFHDYELEEALAHASESQIATQSTVFPGKGDRRQRVQDNPRNKRGAARKLPRPKWMQGSPRVNEADDADDEVPASLLIEGEDEGETQKPPAPPLVGISNGEADIPAPGASTQETRKRWEKAQAHQQLHPDRTPSPSIPRPFPKGPKGLAFVDPKEKAMWRWANVDNLDLFLRDVYTYFLGNGFWSIMLSRVLNLLTLGFVVGFTTFLTHCVNYHMVPSGSKMGDILVDQCTKKMSGTFSFLLWLFMFFWIWKAFQYLVEVRKLRHMHDFYYHLLRISDDDIQTISWQEIVRRLEELRDANPATANAVNAVHRRFIGNQSKQRMDAHDIANRLMRKENYLIALFNKDILDLTLPIPFLRNRQLFTRTLEWNIYLCILDYAFNEHGQVRPLFLKDTHRRALSEGLRKRFRFAGFMNIFAAPFLVTYFLMHYFFRYFTEYQRNPSEIGSRQYNPFAEWKFREFNELWHLFQRRTNMSYPFATRYVDQFPKDKTIQAARFVMFVAGALIAVLAIGSILDPKLFLNFEITTDRTVLFYLGILGAIWAVARGIVPEETLVFDPEFALREVIDFTHYRPAHWDGRLHSDEVRKEFAMFYQVKVVIFIEEILSMITTPFVLWFSLPKCSDRIIDFFREFTVHVDGIGYVCSFAVFDFKKGGNMMSQAKNQQGNSGEDLRDDYYSTKDGKMLASYYGFMDNYATNPKHGAPNMHRSPRRRFHPPPSFHELTSPPFPAEMGGTGSVRNDRWDRQPHSAMRPLPGPAFGHQSAHRTPRFGASGAPSSPLPSMLLDPHHQPSTSGFRSINRVNTQSRFRQARHPVADTIEDEEEDGLNGVEDAGAAASGEGLTDQSNLGESWKTTRAGAVDDDEEGQAAEGEKGTGVLGLIYQFQKAQTDGRGPGAAGV